jgi:hypothetical protein
VVLNITCIIEFRGGLGGGHSTLELGHDDLHGLSNDISQDVETTSMGHTNNKVGRTIIDCSVNSTLKAGNETLATFETKSFHGVEFLGKESTEIVGPIEPIVKMEQLFLGHAVILNTLKFDSNPITDFFLRNMLKFDSNLVAVGVFICRNYIFKLPQFLLLEN